MTEPHPPAPIRVLLVDDQELVRAGFRIILESEPGITVVGEAGNGEQAVAAARALAPDVICMDVQMPGMDGLEATRLITADPALGASVLMLTTFNREDYLFTALQSGASGFLLKNASPEDLVNAVQVLARGDALLSPDVTRQVIAAATAPTPPPAAEHTPPPVEPPSPLIEPVEIPAPGRGTPASAQLASLTDREAEVLQLLAVGLSNAEIAARLFVGEATVKSHVSKVLMKLGLRDRIQAVIFAYEQGLMASRA
ncbi:response regulator [Microterricola viridarii]|uniref:DNA-binding response regulator, NarL/FixJ family, contains REC and HTH domains n=1 Tax=Microterricola viridarii TaxID=412690 RepID=A0A1H1N377_9MICO|nr:response regulator transcription factor [Microterricola viridarii]SDR93350.1 DNA-binding response regulator, NarL/FixJ family, contains REC and HTH domains [Microterricola viridarii]